MTLMADPVDTRINPTAVNRLATSRPIAWFERKLIATVPPHYAGAWRRVYPGFIQRAAFISMNLDRHVKEQFDLFGPRRRRGPKGRPVPHRDAWLRGVRLLMGEQPIGREALPFPRSQAAAAGIAQPLAPRSLSRPDKSAICFAAA